MPEKNEAFEEIEKHRAEIDAIDQKLVALLNVIPWTSEPLSPMPTWVCMTRNARKRSLRALQRTTRALCITKTLLRSIAESLRL